jgi:PAS domain S-box-containing protein
MGKMRIKIEVSQEQNRKLLENFLSERYEIVEGDFDLLIIDGPSLRRKWREIERLKSKIIPVLLITTRRDVGLARKHLWKRVDEVIFEPIEKLELLARIEALLRMRMQALQLEQHARIMEIELGTLFESIAHPIVVISPDFEILHANKHAQKIFREQGIENAIGEKCYKVFHGRDEPVENCPCVATLKNHKPETREIEIFGRIYAVSTTPIFIKGELKKVVHLAVDVTDFKTMERRLEKLYRANLLLHEIERAILSAQKTKEILKMTAEKLAEMLPVRGVGITVFENGGARVLAVTDKKMPGFREGEIIAGEDIAMVMQTLSQGKPWVKRVEGRGEGERKLMELGIKSYVLIPIISDSLLGSINIPAEEEDAFDEETIRILMEVANSVALAIRNASMREELERRANRLQILNEVNTAILREAELHDIFYSVLSLICRFFDYTYSVILRVVSKDEIVLVESCPIRVADLPEQWKDFRFEVILEKTKLKSGDIIQLDYEKAKSILDEEVLKIIEPYGVKTSVLVPFKVNEELYILDLISTKERELSEDERLILSEISSSLSVAITNSILHENLKKYAQELEKLVEERTKQLAESEKRYRLLVESPIVAFWEADANAVFTFVNRKLLEMSGYSYDEVVGKMTMFEPIAPELREWLAERIRLHKEHKLFADVVEAELLRKDGSRFSVLVSPSPIYDEEGNLVRIVGAMIDITDRKMAEEKLRKTLEELRKANEELEAYVHAISHDLS